MSTANDFQHISVERFEAAIVIQPSGKTLNTQATVMAVVSECDRLLACDAGRNVVLDLAGVSMISSLFLGKLLGLKQTITESGGALSVCNVGRKVYTVFAITRLNTVVDIQPDREAALAAIERDALSQVKQPESQQPPA